MHDRRTVGTSTNRISPSCLHLCLAGLLQGVASLNEDDLEEDTRLALYAQEEQA